MATRKCPVCGVGVKLENLERHVRNQHPRSEVDSAAVLTTAERARTKRAVAKRPVVSGRGLRVAAGVGIVVALVLVVAIANPFRGTGPGVGQLAPNFVVPTTTGTSLELESLRGTPVLLEFMDVDCHFCQAEARDVLSGLFTNYGGRVRFLSVDVNFVGSEDTMSRIDGFKTDYHTPWMYALDDLRHAQTAYGVSSTPTTFILDRNGVVVRLIVGQASGGAAWYAEALDAALRV